MEISSGFYNVKLQFFSAGYRKKDHCEHADSMQDPKILQGNNIITKHSQMGMECHLEFKKPKKWFKRRNMVAELIERSMDQNRYRYSFKSDMKNRD